MIILQVILEALIVVLIYSAGFSIFLFTYPIISKYYREWKWERRNKKYNQYLAKLFEETLQQERRRKLHAAERKKYPLFYWKENIK